MHTVTVTVTRTNDPEITRRVHERLVESEFVNSPKIERVSTGSDELGVVETIVVSIASANLIINLVKLIIDWRKSEKIENSNSVDFKIELKDTVIQIFDKRNSSE